MNAFGNGMGEIDRIEFKNDILDVIPHATSRETQDHCCLFARFSRKRPNEGIQPRGA